MKLYLGVESKRLGGCSWPGHPALALIASVLALEFAAWLRLPYGESH